jgi:hypothetical protein
LPETADAGTLGDGSLCKGPTAACWTVMVAATAAAIDVATAAPLMTGFEDMRGPELCENHLGPFSRVAVCLLNMFNGSAPVSDDDDNPGR